RTYNYFGVNGDDFKIPTKPTVGSATNVFPSYTPLQEKRINSLYGAATLSFRNMVYLDVSGRNDWSSTLPEDNWSYFYPSASLSFMLNEIVDLSSARIDFLKLRGSWAKVGGDTDPYQLDIAYNLASTTSSYLGLTTLTKPSTRLNPDLKPEQTTSIEAGLELRMFLNRLYFDASYYTIKSEDLIMDVPVSPSTGYSTFRSNVGQITNKGFEFILGGIPFQTDNLTWDVSMNFSKNENTLDELIEGLEDFTFSDVNSGIVTVRATVGEGFGDIWGTDYKRTDDGRLIVDANGRPQATSEHVKLGNYQPDWIGGMTNTLRYKDLSLNILIEARFGGQLFSGSTASLDGAGVSERSLDYRETGILVDGVVNTGTVEEPVYQTNTQSITAQEYFGSITGIASEYIFDQTNIRLREIALSYRLPGNFFENIFLESATVSLIGRNLFFIYSEMKDFDPISSYSTSNFAQGMLWFNLPTTRSIGFNINVKF
ncbi:MAG: TonB-dependent receptor, partial [Bacteroidales bacterium]